MNPAMSTYRTPLSSIELMVLLDLLGAENPRVPSYYKTTHWAYKAMAKAESRLRSLGKFKSVPFGQPDKTPQTELFLHDAEKSSGWWMGGMIDDDHAPFMSRGVEVLHLIPGPFPEVWHKITDDGEHLDLPTVHDWAILVTAFTAEWMDLDASLTTDSNRLLSRAEIDKPLKDKQNSGHWSRNEL